MQLKMFPCKFFVIDELAGCLLGLYYKKFALAKYQGFLSIIDGYCFNKNRKLLLGSFLF
jgi:hypothetical protein